MPSTTIIESGAVFNPFRIAGPARGSADQAPSGLSLKATLHASVHGCETEAA